MLLGDGICRSPASTSIPCTATRSLRSQQAAADQGGQTLTLTEDVPYQIPGTAAGFRQGHRAPASITSYTVTACPADVSILDPFPSFSCVTEYSGSGAEFYGPTTLRCVGVRPTGPRCSRAAGVRINSYDLPSLTAGQWSLSVGYSTAFGSFFAPESTTVNVIAGQTTTTKLSTPYQEPTVGAVTGKVSVIGAPEDFQAGAMACSTAPTAGTCTDEVDAYLGTDGDYQARPGPRHLVGVGRGLGLRTDVHPGGHHGTPPGHRLGRGAYPGEPPSRSRSHRVPDRAHVRPPDGR